MEKALQQFIQFLIQMGMPSDVAPIVAERFRFKQFTKGEYLVREGEQSNMLAYLAEGTLQYFQEREGEELPTHIARAGDFITSLKSYIQGGKSKENLRAINDITLLYITRNEQLILCEEIPAFKDLMITLLEHSIVCIDDSKNSFIVLSAEERYLKLLKEEPQLMQDVPLYLVAALLGVTPRHLTRIRGAIE